MVIDVCTYNGEKEMWDLHYNALKPYVDRFIVVEAPTTFSGKPKPLYFKEIQHIYPVEYFVIDENYTPEEVAVAESSPNTRGASHWKHEFLQKESIKKAIKADDNDLVFIGDVDEIWDKSALFLPIMSKLKLKVYVYWLNNRSSEEFWGTIVGKWGEIKDKCLNHLRTETFKTGVEYGWHFTSMGGYDEVKRKLSDSYTRESYWTPDVEFNLQNNITLNRDFLGRSFNYRIDETGWPQYLKDNKEKYARLIR